MRHQANINHQDSQKKTPLLHAVEQKHLRAVRLLLTFGADKSLTDNRGNTAHSLALSKNFEAIASLIERFPYKPYKFVKKDEANMSENSCNICLEDLEPTSNFAIAKCGHYYHSSCLIQTALSGYSCPLCQEEFTGL
jgi:hypothetical protein